MMKKLLLGFLLIMLFPITRCGKVPDGDIEPDEDFSEIVNGTFGDDYYYLGREETKRYDIHYQFQINQEDAEIIEEFHCLANDHFLRSDKRSRLK